MPSGTDSRTTRSAAADGAAAAFMSGFGFGHGCWDSGKMQVCIGWGMREGSVGGGFAIGADESGIASPATRTST